jgi:hypothetical protein
MKRNVLVCFEEDNVLLFNVESLTCEQITQWAEKVCGNEVVDCFDIQDNELQYYIIDDRIKITQEKESLILKQIGL